jgi:His/Glu/Gln/Arg/opine family amino acid ABC transporter permease subunit
VLDADALAFLPLVLQGAGVTVAVTLAATALAVGLGLLGAALRLSASPTARLLGASYATAVRAVPDLVVMLLLFYGGQILANRLVAAAGLETRVEIPAFAAAVASIGLIFGSYMAESFRSAYLAIPKGQVEAARALGLRPRQWLGLVVWPQFVPLALPAFTNNYLVLMKTTALASIIGLQDVTFVALQAGRTTREPFLFLIAALLVYLLFTLASDAGLGLLARRYRAR